MAETKAYDEFQPTGSVLKYTPISETEAAVTGYSAATDFVIPATINNNGGTTYNVTSIGDNAFDQCASLKSVTIPNSVTNIGSFAFSGCTSLASVTIPSSVTDIGYSAFGGCTSLKSVTIPKSVTTIGDYTFQGCTSLASVTISSGVTSISGYAFLKCTSLASVTIPNSVTSIGEGAFLDCTNLTSITYTTGNNSSYRSTDGVLFGDNGKTLLYYPAGHKDAGTETASTTYTIPNDVTSIGENAFNNCSRLVSVIIPNSVISIGNFAFENCVRLASVTIPNSMRSIGNNAFENCVSLASVTIPNSVTSIGTFAFNSCSKLASVTIPNSVTSIGVALFQGCTSLKSVTIPNSVTNIGSNAFSSCISLKSVTIPNSVTSIGNDAFVCTSLTSVTIPNSVTSIGDRAFGYCNNLSTVSAENWDVVCGTNAFDGIASSAKLYVPKSRSTASGWSYWPLTTESGTLTLTPRTDAGRDQAGSEKLTFAAGEPLTRYFHYPVDLPAGVTAYTGKLNDSKTMLNLTQITSTYAPTTGTNVTYIPADTPVLLFKTDGTAGDVVLTESSKDDYTPANESTNDLKGSITDSYFGEANKILTLGHNNADYSEYGFFKYTGTTARANRAYLLASDVAVTGAQGIGISMGEPTGIEEIGTTKKPASIGTDRVYNIDGSYEPNPKTGTVYIVNGKKVIYLK